MLGPDKQLVLTIEIGDAAVRVVRFAPGRPVAPITIGTAGSWPMHAPGVKPVHVSVTFDGDVLYASGAGGEVPVYVNGAPIDERWWPVAAPAELRFGAALLRLVVTEPSSRPAQDAPIGGSTMYVEPPAPVQPRAASPSGAPAQVFTPPQPAPQAPERPAPAILGHTSLDAGGYWENRHRSERDDGDAMNRTRLGPPSQSPGVLPHAHNRATPPAQPGAQHEPRYAQPQPAPQQRYAQPQPAPQHEQHYAPNHASRRPDPGTEDRAQAPGPARLPSLVAGSPLPPDPARAPQAAPAAQYPSPAFQPPPGPAAYPTPAPAPFSPAAPIPQENQAINIHEAGGQTRESGAGTAGQSPTAASLGGRRPTNPPVMAATVVKANYAPTGPEVRNDRAPEMASTVPRPGFVPDGQPGWPAPDQAAPLYAGHQGSLPPPAAAPQPHWGAQQGAWPAPDASSAGDGPAEKGGLLASWRSLSLPKKATAALVPAAFLLLLLPQPQEEAPAVAPSSTATTAPAAGAEPRAVTAVTATVARPAVPPPTAAARTEGQPTPSAVPKGATPRPTQPVAPVSTAPPDPKPAGGAPTEVDPVERAAIDAAFEGRWADALNAYEQLASAHPDQPAFKEAARIVREKQQPAQR